MHLQLNLFEAIGIKLLFLYINRSFRLCLCGAEKALCACFCGVGSGCREAQCEGPCIFRGVSQSVSRQNKFI